MPADSIRVLSYKIERYDNGFRVTRKGDLVKVLPPFGVFAAMYQEIANAQRPTGEFNGSGHQEPETIDPPL